MSACVLVQGKLARDPEQRTSRAGNPFAMATIRDGFGDDATFWKVFVFGDEPREELMSLHAGDSVAVSGSFKAELYAKAGGEPRVSLTVTADRLISAKRAKREKAQGGPGRAAADRPAKRSARPAAVPFVPDAEIPF